MKLTETVEVFHKVGDLKKIKRSGWLRYNISNPESVADHTFRVAFIAMILGDHLGADTLKLIKMALIHDIPELSCGDITPHDGISLEEKRKKEEDGIKKILLNLPNGQEYVDLWREFEEGKSIESKILKDIDKLEMAIQASEYKREHQNKDFSEFFTDAEAHIRVPEICTLFEAIKKNNGE